jgi:hypothetical protein
MTTTREREPEPFKPTRSTTKIVQPRKGYSEQILPDSFCSLVEVFCLPDQSIFISNGYKFSTWNIQDKTFTKVKKEEPRYGSTYKIIKVGNSNSLFVYEDTYT